MATSSEVQSLYIAYFGRPADPEGLRYWTEGVGQSTPLAEIASGFATTPEFKFDTEGRPVQEVINKFYLNLFGRPGEVDGVNYWTGLVNDGLLTLEEVGLNIAQAALDFPPNNPDRIAEESKITAAQRFTTAIGASTDGVIAYTGANAVAFGRSFLDPVVSPATTPTVAETEATVNVFIAGGGGGPNVLDLTINQDVFTAIQGERVNAAGTVVATLPFRFTSSDQIVNGTAASFNVTGPADNLGDTLEDPSTSDQDTLTITNIGNLFNFAGAQSGAFITVSNIENLNLGLSNAVGFYDFFNDTNWSGVQSIVATGTVSGTTSNPTFFDLWAEGTDATSWDSSAVDNNAFLAVVSGFSTNDLTVSTGDTNDYISTSFGNDLINAGGGNDYIDAQEGADTTTLGSGNDEYGFDFGDGGGALTVFLDTGLFLGFFDNGDSFEFNGPIDTITDFNQAQDTFFTQYAGNVFNTNNLAGDLTLFTNVNQTNFFIRGDYNGNSFTVSDAGQDTLVGVGDNSGGFGNIFTKLTDSDFFVLENFTTPLTPANFA